MPFSITDGFHSAWPTVSCLLASWQKEKRQPTNVANSAFTILLINGIHRSRSLNSIERNKIQPNHVVLKFKNKNVPPRHLVGCGSSSPIDFSLLHVGLLHVERLPKTVCISGAGKLPRVAFLHNGHRQLLLDHRRRQSAIAHQNCLRNCHSATMTMDAHTNSVVMCLFCFGFAVATWPTERRTNVLLWQPRQMVSVL